MTVESINIIVPLKNEEKSIENLLNNLKPVISENNKKIVISLIDDHSTDQTWQVIQDYKKKLNFVKIYKNEYEGINEFYNDIKTVLVIHDLDEYSTAIKSELLNFGIEIKSLNRPSTG